MSQIEAYLAACSQALNEAASCECKALNAATTYPDLCFATMKVKEMLRDLERKDEIAWMVNLERILGLKEAPDGR